MTPVAIVGGGLAGLTAARALRRRDVPVTVFEAGARLAGLMQSFRDEEGFAHDFGAHFVTNRLAASLGLGARCVDVPRYGEVVRLDGADLAYPFGLLGVPRFVQSALTTRGRPPRPPRHAADWFRAAYGEALADEVALPLVEAWSGLPADQLSPAVGDKLPGGLLQTLLLKLAGRLTRRAVAIGYSRELPHGAHVWHVYPVDGVAALCERLAADVRDAIALESRVEAIYVERGRAVGLRVNGRDVPASAVVSTAPVHVLPALVQGTDALAPLADLRYRAMVFVNLRLAGRGLLPDVVQWFPEPGRPFFRLTEAPLAMPDHAPAGKTQVTCDLGCAVGDLVWRLPDDRLADLCLEQMEDVIPDVRRRFLGARVLRTPVAYPVFASSYEAVRRRWQAGTGVKGLYSVGRNGEFDHILMEDVFVRTLRKVPDIVRDVERQARGRAPWEEVTAPVAPLAPALEAG